MQYADFGIGINIDYSGEVSYHRDLTDTHKPIWILPQLNIENLTGQGMRNLCKHYLSQRPQEKDKNLLHTSPLQQIAFHRDRA